MNYIIVYNNTQNFDPNELHGSITNLSGVIDWWHYLPNVYIVSTKKTSKELADDLIKKHPGLLFLISQLNLQDHNGVLNKSAWDWITNKINKKISLKIAPQPTKSILDILSTLNPPNPPERFDILEYLRKKGISS